jgi:hypothetical protein
VQKAIDASHTRNPVVTDSVQSILHQLGVLESVLDTKIQDQTPVTEPPAASSTLVGAVMLHKQQIPICKWGITFSGKVLEMSVNSFLERVEAYRVARGVSTQQIPVCKWGITFSGKVLEMSVNSFLERVEEYRVARGVSTQQIPVCKWGITFSGKVLEMSVNSFLERVEEYRVARGVSTHELLASAIDLLEGPALIWYRSVRSTVHSWEEFVRLIRLEYLPFDYEHELWSEIRHRVQGAEESVGAYFACMINLFNRLPVQSGAFEHPAA